MWGAGGLGIRLVALLEYLLIGVRNIQIHNEVKWTRNIEMKKRFRKIICVLNALLRNMI